MIFLIQPVELLKCLGLNFMPTLLNEAYYPTLKTVTDSGDFWDMITTNATMGQLASLFWAGDMGQLLQAPGLFILGMILARGDYFTRGSDFWVRVFVLGFTCSIALYVQNQQRMILCKRFLRCGISLPLLQCLLPPL